MSNFLTQNENSGDFLPTLRWGSDAVQWFYKNDGDLTGFHPKTAIFDMENIKLGWIKIDQGVFDAILEHNSKPVPQRPDEKVMKNGRETYAYSNGFAVNVFFKDAVGGANLFEFSTSQKGSLEAVGAILDQYNEGKAANPGKVPVVEFGPHTHRKMGKGSTNIPGLKIVQWVDRPAGLDAAPEPANEPAQEAPTAQAAGSEW